MAEYKTPGVYVEEISTFPASVVRVATAVPIFIGYTELAGPDVLNVPTKIKSLVEYEQLYGGEPTNSGRSMTATLTANGDVESVDLTLGFYLYNSLRHFYANGGGDAYILAVDTYNNALDKAKLIAGIAILEKVDEPTLVLIPDAYALGAAGLGDVQVQVLSHCNKMQDRFAILDVITSVSADSTLDSAAFRNGIGTSNLKYGAAYYPVLHTSIGPNGPIAGSSITLAGPALESIATNGGDPVLLDYARAASDMAQLTAGIAIGASTKSFAGWYDATLAAINEGPSFAGNVAATRTHLKDNVVTRMNAMTGFLYGLRTATFKMAALTTARNTLVAKTTVGGLKTYVETLTKVDIAYREIKAAYALTSAATAVLGVVSPPAYEVATFEYGLAGINLVSPADNAAIKVIYGAGSTSEKEAAQAGIEYLRATLTSLKASYDALTAIVTRSFDAIVTTSKVMAGIVSSIRNTGYTLPPSGAIAGVYATVDASRGVWKAPANVSLAAVASVAKIPDEGLSNLNVDITAGKSINAIRFFRGQGILVYGARTLAGNDNEWRYVPVRRLFIMVEESVRKASEPFVFEPNDGNTWQRIKAMIENFLLGVWRDGGLAGAVPKDAFFVKVGLGQTMTAQDILEGKLIIEIGMAAVRPAEFVILRFSHKMQEN